MSPEHFPADIIAPQARIHKYGVQAITALWASLVPSATPKDEDFPTAWVMSVGEAALDFVNTYGYKDSVPQLILDVYLAHWLPEIVIDGAERQTQPVKRAAAKRLKEVLDWYFIQYASDVRRLR
jgi:hypothetical protein